VTHGARADLSRLHVLLPLRSLATGKARLGGAIDAEERETLLLGMLRLTLRVLASWPACRMVHLVSADTALLASSATDGAGRIRPLLQRGEGLNEALASARADAVAHGATAVLMLPADLPLLATEPLDRLLEAADAAVAAGSESPIVVIAPADARRGTNALLLSPPYVIEPSFGVLSLEAHVRAAAAADASVQIVVDARLGFDLDTPDDLERLEPALLDQLIALGERPIAAGVE